MAAATAIATEPPVRALAAPSNEVTAAVGFSPNGAGLLTESTVVFGGAASEEAVLDGT